MNFALVGCGVVGQKRARAMPPGSRIVVAADLVEGKARSLGCEVSPCREAIKRSDVDAVIVATTNDALVEVSCAALEEGKPVLVEKPAARCPRELDELIEAHRKTGLRVQAGFNHRYHPAMKKARELIDDGALGSLMFARGRYGHGGRMAYDREWRADPVRSGGGELIDQGVHLIDLARWYLGEFSEVEGHASTLFWDMPVDDNAFLSLRTHAGRTAWLHVSCTEWKNLFSLEIYGRNGKLHIEGLGGSYGVERLSWYRMLPEMGPPETTIWEYPGEDVSWRREIEAFVANDASAPGLEDARKALEIVQKIYVTSGYDHHA